MAIVISFATGSISCRHVGRQIAEKGILRLVVEEDLGRLHIDHHYSLVAQVFILGCFLFNLFLQIGNGFALEES